MANMGQISALLKPLGWSLAVVPELDALTVLSACLSGALFSQKTKRFRVLI
jgi:hypothetical protein